MSETEAWSLSSLASLSPSFAGTSPSAQEVLLIAEPASSISEDPNAPLTRDPPAGVGGRLPHLWLVLTLASALGIFGVATTTAAILHRLQAAVDVFTSPVGGAAAAAGDAIANRDSRDELENVVALSPHTYAFEDEDVLVAGSPLLGAAPSGAGTNSRCVHPRFSFCTQPKGSVYFEPDLGACLASPPETVHVCNRSPNRFASLAECRSACVENARPERRCLDAPLFTRCDEELALNGTRWFSNGTDCDEWHFPLGQCPAQGSSLFDSEHQCRDKCLQPTDKLSCCHTPDPSVCSLEQLRYPYFAIVGFDGCFRCLESSAKALQEYQCLTGLNQFESMADCNRTCVDGATT